MLERESSWTGCRCWRGIVEENSFGAGTEPVVVVVVVAEEEEEVEGPVWGMTEELVADHWLSES